MPNIINAIMNIVKQPIHELSNEYINVRNRVNNEGDALEQYIVDSFADTFNDDPQTRMRKINNVFSYLGNASNPPDAMLRGGDAIEVKKVSSSNSGVLQLNSSYPKFTMTSDSPMITHACRTAEENWGVKDMLYIVGQVNSGVLSNLTMVYGVDYAADSSIYEGFKNRLYTEIGSIPGIEFQPTRELGRINRIDPLGITSLRIRGMWLISKPNLVFNYLELEDRGVFNLNVIINDHKWARLANRDELLRLEQIIPNLIIEDVIIKNTNNPAGIKNAKLIKFSM